VNGICKCTGQSKGIILDINIIAETVARDLCSSCGVCVGVCPANALTMTMLANGDLAPQAGPGDCLEKCHLCLDVCPFSTGVHDPRPTNEAVYREQLTPAKFHDDIGWHLSSMVGYRDESGLRERSASGGLATWCLEQLLGGGLVTRAAVVRFSGQSKERPFEFFAAESIDELRSATGSVYHPVSMDEIIRLILSGKEKWAVIGVPCLCAAIANARRVRTRVPYLLGLACGGYQNRFYTDLLLTHSGMAAKKISKIDFRLKDDDGPASNFSFQAKASGDRGKQIPYLGLPLFLGLNGYFGLGSCDFCKDVFAELADACFTDAWLPEYHRDPAGTSLVVLRNKQLDALFKQGGDSGELVISEITADRVVASQAGHVRRKRVWIDYRLGLSSRDVTLRERFIWRLQRITRTRSKSAWARREGATNLLGFWLAMLDLLVVQVAIYWVIPKLLSPLKKLLRKMGVLSKTAST
jgi:coenzyme F420 hydrogenase subunit beta